MATITRQDIIQALERLGQLAEANNEQVELVLVGGAAMVLVYNTRQSTHDVDAIILKPHDAQSVRALAKIIATERGWAEDWFNDAAKGYLVGYSKGPVIFAASGIEVRRPSLAQLLAMKLSAWRDDVDIADATHLLKELEAGQSPEEVWQKVKIYLIPGSELKAQYAFLDLWETLYGDT